MIVVPTNVLVVPTISMSSSSSIVITSELETESESEGCGCLVGWIIATGVLLSGILSGSLQVLGLSLLGEFTEESGATLGDVVHDVAAAGVSAGGVSTLLGVVGVVDCLSVSVVDVVTDCTVYGLKSADFEILSAFCCSTYLSFLPEKIFSGIACVWLYIVLGTLVMTRDLPELL